MPNYWSDPKPQVVDAKSHYVHGYGYLYVFYMGREGRTFRHMSQVFVPKELGGDSISIYKHFKEMTGKIGIKPITSLNDTKGRTMSVVEEAAKAYADKREDEQRKAREWKEKQEAERGEPADPEWVSNLIQQKLKEWQDEDKKASSNWYNDAKLFVKAIIEDPR
jgi:hypothetical protein